MNLMHEECNRVKTKQKYKELKDSPSKTSA